VDRPRELRHPPKKRPGREVMGSNSDRFIVFSYAIIGGLGREVKRRVKEIGIGDSATCVGCYWKK